LYKLLKLFHVCSRYTSLSEGNVLPADINYFGKCLLGETSIDCFSKTLNQSVRNAELYLDVSHSHLDLPSRDLSSIALARSVAGALNLVAVFATT
jgi:hypothetical protein